MLSKTSNPTTKKVYLSISDSRHMIGICDCYDRGHEDSCWHTLTHNHDNHSHDDCNHSHEDNCSHEDSCSHKDSCTHTHKNSHSHENKSKPTGPSDIKFKPIKKYTLDIFLERAAILHGDKYDFSKVTSKHIKNAYSEVPVTCNICCYKWNPTIATLINKRHGCKRCAGQEPWTLESFLEAAKKIHGDTICYESVKKSMIKNQKSRVPLTCNICGHEWSPTIVNHINKQRHCPSCTNSLPWTLERFIEAAIDIHGKSFNYSQITKEHIKGRDSHVPVICYICNYHWSPRIHDHIRGKGCPKCAGNNPWTLQSFILAAIEIHNTKYDYSNITDADIKNQNSHLQIKCLKCNKIWSPSIKDHINHKSGCTNCCNSRGYSQAQIDWLDSVMKEQNIQIQYALSPKGEYRIERLGPVDGYCRKTNTIFEYNGNFWHGNPAKFHPDDINKRNGKTFGELYQKTLRKEAKIRKLGYNLIVKWETDLPDSSTEESEQ